MLNKCLGIISAAAVMIIAASFNSYGQDNTPVRIVFDTNAKRIDIVTGKQLPEYTQAQRGSFQFFNGRLDKPDNFFWYYFDGRRNQDIDKLAFIRNMKSIGTWVIALKGDDKIPTAAPNVNCEIEHHAISFIPLNLTTGKPDPRVYVMIEDIHLIQWAPYNHWLAKVSQKEFESMAGRIY